MNLSNFLKQIIALIIAMLPFLGEGAHAVVERGTTVPQKDIDKYMTGASDEDKAEAVRLGRAMADSISDFTVFVASKGKIPAD